MESQSGSEIKCTNFAVFADQAWRNKEDDVPFNPENFNQVVEKYHLALGEFMKGNAAPAKKLYSQRDDVTLGNPFGPFARGWKQVAETMEQAALNYRDGDASGFENIANCVTSDLAYLVEIEQLRSKIGGRGDVTPLALRVTSIFRPEDGLWKIVHRHADPITTAQPADSVLLR
jgi:ketosteroid isomerase-like protein